LLKLSFLEKYNMHPEDFDKLSIKFLKIRQEYLNCVREKRELERCQRR